MASTTRPIASLDDWFYHVNRGCQHAPLLLICSCGPSVLPALRLPLTPPPTCHPSRLPSTQAAAPNLAPTHSLVVQRLYEVLNGSRAAATAAAANASEELDAGDDDDGSQPRRKAGGRKGGKGGKKGARSGGGDDDPDVSSGDIEEEDGDEDEDEDAPRRGPGRRVGPGSKAAGQPGGAVDESLPLDLLSFVHGPDGSKAPKLASIINVVARQVRQGVAGARGGGCQ